MCNHNRHLLSKLLYNLDIQWNLTIRTNNGTAKFGLKSEVVLFLRFLLCVKCHLGLTLVVLFLRVV